MRKLMTLAALAAALVSCSKSVSVRTEPLPDSSWEASEWISAADAPVPEKVADRAPDGASWFLADIPNSRRVQKAVWMTTGLGVYQIFINGRPIGEEILRPGFTHYAKTKISYTYDVTADIKRSRGAVNSFSAQVTPGWWADKIINGRRLRTKKCAFRSVLALTYADGETEYFGTDTLVWKAGIAGPVTHAGIFDGETYDARIPAGYLTPEKLSVPEINREFHGEIVPSCGAEIFLRKDLTLNPVKAYAWEGITDAVDSENTEEVQHGKVNVKREYKRGEPIELREGETLVVDFGQNAAAVPSFVFSADEGTTLVCLPSEILNDGNGAESRGMDGPEGSVHRRNLRMGDDMFRLQYTFGRSGKKVSYTPTCSFWGYRYVSVTASAPVRIESIVSIPVTSIRADMQIGTLETGNPLVNQLISNAWWGQLSNYLSVPTDCPQRNERLGWMADTQVFANTGAYFANTSSFFHKWLRDVRDCQTETGSFPGVCPPGNFGGSHMRLGWTDAGIIVPYIVWKQFADESVVQDCWDSMERFMDHIAGHYYDHTFYKEENGNYQWADWLSYEPLETCSNRAFKQGREPKEETLEYWSFLGACYCISDAAMMKDMAAATGRDTSKFSAIHADALAYAKERFLNPDGSFKLDILNTMQTPALFALHCDLVDSEEAVQAVKARLRENFLEHGNCLQTGFLGTSILMQTLTEYGMTDVAYELLFQRNNPSWLYSVDNGATTIWERWNSYMKDSGMGPRGMNSFNHYAYGCVCQWLWETCAGIAPDKACPGFRHIIMKPVPDKRLGHMKASYKSVSGLIESEWHYEGDTCVWTFSIPSGTSAAVTLPGSSDTTEYGPGTYIVKM